MMKMSFQTKRKRDVLNSYFKLVLPRTFSLKHEIIRFAENIYFLMSELQITNFEIQINSLLQFTNKFIIK